MKLEFLKVRVYKQSTERPSARATGLSVFRKSCPILRTAFLSLADLRIQELATN
jgi:hypothetical protein